MRFSGRLGEIAGRKLPAWSRYVMAVLAVALAVAVRMAFLGALGTRAPFVTFYPAVILAALAGGLRGGLLATALSALVADFAWMEPVGEFSIVASADWLAVAVFAMSGAMISWVSDAMLRAQVRASEAESQVKLATERMRVEEDLHRYQLLAENSRDAILYIRREDGRILDANPAATRAYGYTRDELQSLSIQELHAADTHELTAGQMAEADTAGILFETVHRRKDGSTFPVEVSSQGATIGGLRTLISAIRDITGRKREEDERRRLAGELADRAGELQAILDAAPVAVWIAHDPQCLRITGNAFADRVVMQAQRGDNVSAGAPAGDSAVSYAVFRGGVKLRPEELPSQVAAATGQPVNGEEMEMVFPGGRTVHLLLSAVPLLDGGGRVRGSVAAGVDITRRTQAERELRESESILRSFFDSPGSMRGIVEIVDSAIVHVSCNEAAAELYGVDRASIAGTSAVRAGASEEVARFWVTLYEKSRRTGKPVSMEYARRDAHGRERWLLATAGYLGNGHSGNPRFAYTILDLTERKRAEEALRESEAHYRTLSETMLQGVVYQDAEGKILSMNPAAETILGKTRDEFLGRTSVDVERDFIREDGSPFPGLEHPAMAALATGREVRNVSMGVYNSREKQFRWIEINAVPLFRAGEAKPYQVYTIFEDITGRKLAGEALRRQREWLEVTLNSIGDGVLSTDAGGRITFLNPVAARLTGWTEEQALGQPAQDVLRIVREQTRDAAEDIIGRVLREGCAVSMGDRTALLARDGRETPIDDSAAPIRDSAGNLLGVVLVFQDVTEKRRAHQELQNVLGSISDGMLVLDRNWRYTYFSEQGARMIGMRREDLIGGCVWELFPHAKGTAFYEEYHRAMETGQPATFEEYYPEPVNKWLECHCYPSEAGLSVYFHDITERRRALVALRESEARLRTLGDNLPDGALYRYRLDASGEAHVDFISAGIERLTGVPASEYMNDAATVERSIVAEDVDRLHAAIALSRERLARFDIEVRHIHRTTGETRWSLMRSIPSRCPDGSTVWDGIEIDITERKRVEVELRHSEERYRTLFDTIIEGFCVIEVIFDAGVTPVDYRFLEINPAFESQTGLKNAQGRLMRELAPEHEAHWFEIYGQVALTGQPARLVNEAKALHRWFDVSAYRIGGPESRKVAILFNDITERKRVEDALRESRAHLQAALASMADAVFISDAAGRFVEFNDAFAGFHRFPSKAECATTFAEYPDILDVFLPDGTLAPLDRWAVPRALRGEVVTNAEYTLRRKDTGETWIGSYSFAPIRGPDGAIAGSVVVARDITGHKHAEEALRESEAQFRTLANAIPQLCWMANADGWIFWYNQRWYEYTGTTPEQMEGWGWQSVHDPEALARVLERWQGSIATGEPFDMVFPLRGADGVFRPFLTRVMPVRDRDGKVARWFGTNTDISEQRRAEQEIQQLNTELEQRVRERTAQLEAANKELEAFAYSVSHDLRAPLRGIDGWSLALAEDYAGQLDDRAHQYLERVRSEAQRMGLLIDDLLQLSRITRAEMERGTVELSSIAQAIAARLREAHADRRIEFVIGPALTADGDARLLEIALTNLLENAVKFTGPCAQARIEFGETECAGERAYYVRDNGVGFDMAFAGKLFGAFQRLHKTSEFPGTGIGLATVQRIIHRHGGRVWAEAVPGRGATFYFTIGAQ
ncbi:MAG: PAS domain S-box protein [Acidobacteriia bacterium]|nr:PAS domain S-box protein [Terriglobia bacterium]